MRSVLRRVSLAAVALAIATWSSRADASAFQLVEQNGSGLGNAYAGQAAAAEDASTIFWNPAGMAFLPGLQASAAVSLVRPTTKFENQGSVPSPLPGATAGGDGGDAGGLNVVPNGYASWEVLKNRAWAGVGVNVPFGLTTEWDSDWAGRFHAVKSEVKTVNINPSAAAKLNEWLSIGAGVNVQWLDAELSNQVNYAAIVFGQAFQAAINQGASPAAANAAAAAQVGAVGQACANSAPGGVNCQGIATVKGDSWGFGWNVGVMLNLPTQTRIGASYRSAIEHDIEGDVTFGNRPAPLATAIPDGDIEATIDLPDTVSIAVSQQLQKLQLLADFTWTHWAKLQELAIFRASGAGLTRTPLEFENSWRVGLGANYQLFDALKVRGGVAYDVTPVKDADRTPRLPDQDRLWLATGAQWAFSKQGAIDLGFAWLFVKEASTNLGQPAPTAEFPAQAPRGTLRGSYTDTNVWIAGAQAKYAF
jgi:long-chain fatty acid transport protein